MKSADEAVVTKPPCSDCPWRRSCLAGWTGLMSPREWIAAAHGEAVIDCHTRKRNQSDFWQCAGAAIYRRNVCKTTRTEVALVLPADRLTVFACAPEFLAHHCGRVHPAKGTPST